MAATKFSVSAYTADGVTTDYLITWDYLDNDHIAVYVDGTANYDPTSTYTFELLNSTTVRVTDEFGNAVPAGAEIEVRRETPVNTRAVTFNDGSALLAEDLNKNSDYLLYSMQEVLDTVEAAAQDGALAAQVATEGLRDETEVLRATTEGYKNETLAARDTTQTYLATVDADATAADNHRIAAAASEAAALASKNAAAASQAASATSEANAAASEAASAASEAAAAVSQAAALASENAAATSESNAAASETAAQTAQAAAEAALDELTDLYLGAKTAAPTVDNDGNALQTGALYWNSTNDTMFVWNGLSWDTFNSTIGVSDSATGPKLFISDTNVGVNINNPTGVLETYTGQANAWGVVTSSNGQNHSGVWFDANNNAQLVARDSSGFANYISNTGNNLSVVVNGSEAMKITTNKDVIVGKPNETGPNYNTVGVDLTRYGEGQFTTDNRTVATFNRLSSDGDLVKFMHNGVDRGQITSEGNGWIKIGRGDTALGFIDGGASGGADRVIPRSMNPSAVTANGTIDLGDAGSKFRDGYFSGTLSSGNLSGNFKVLGTSVSYESGRYMHLDPGLSVFSAYAGGSGSPHTYDVALGVYNYGRAMQFSGNWISSGGPIYIRTLRDCCINWSSWQGLSQYAVSDRRAKNDIEEFTNPRNIIDQLQAYEFNYTNEDGTVGEYDEDEPDAALLPPTRQIGYMAQDIKDVVPHAVMYNKNFDTPNEHGWANAYSVDYEKIVPVLSEALKDVYAKLDEVQARLDAAEAEIEVLKNG